MDNICKQDLLVQYSGFLKEKLGQTETPQESDFLLGLRRELQIGYEEVSEEVMEMGERRGKSKAAFHELFDEIKEIALQQNPDAVLDSEALFHYGNYKRATLKLNPRWRT